MLIHLTGFSRKRKMECDGVYSRFWDPRVWSEVKSSETVQVAMLQCAPLYHIIWSSLRDREDHMIYKRRRIRPAQYEPASVPKTRFSTIKDLHRNLHWKLKQRVSHELCCRPWMVERTGNQMEHMGHTALDNQTQPWALLSVVPVDNRW